MRILTALAVSLLLCAPAVAEDIHAMACVQKQLNHLNLSAGPVDGLIGSNTRAAADRYIAWMKETAEPGWAQPRLTARNAAHWCEKVGEAHPNVAQYWREYNRM